MPFTIINNDREILEKLLPVEVCDHICNRKGMVATYMEFGQVIAYAAFAPFVNRPEIAQLYHIFVDEDFRRAGMGEALIDYSVAELKKRGITGVYVRFDIEENNGPSIERFFLGNEFVFLCDYGRHITYEYSEVKHSPKLKFLMDSSENLNTLKIEKILSMDDYRLKHFVRSKKDPLCPLYLHEYNGEYSRYYIHNDNIEGAIYVSFIRSKNLLLVESTYISKEFRQPAIIAGLFNKVLDGVLPEMTEDMKIGFNCTSKEVKKQLSDLFGEPLDESAFVSMYLEI